MRVALAQINTTLGDFKGNRKKIVNYISDSIERKCDLVVFPESTIFGYHPFDLLEREDLVRKQLKEIIKIQKFLPKGIAVLVGGISLNPSKSGRPYYNSVYFLEKGKKAKVFNKELLPTGDVFDEGRFIEHGDIKKNTITYKKNRILITICEDIWAWKHSSERNLYKENPLLQFKKQKFDLIINMSASPFYPHKLKVRQELVSKTARLIGCPMVYVNLVGGQDEIVFDGQSFAVNKSGKVIAQNLAFEEDLNVIDTKTGEGGWRKQSLNKAEYLRQAIVLGLRDFCKKNRLTRVHFGLSGGIDSALVACLAVDALGSKNVSCWALPGPFSNPSSLKLAQELASNLDIEIKEFSIVPTYNLFKNEIENHFSSNNPQGSVSVVHENLQARLRGLWLMAYSNANSSLLLATSNKSELATGYSTLYGDMCGGLMPIGDLLKKEVYLLANHYNLERQIIPSEIINRPPTAELRPNQTDQDSLPPYEDLDSSVKKIVEDISVLKSKTDKWLFHRLLQTEFKRWQSPPIIKISKHSFGRGRRYPISQSVI